VTDFWLTSELYIYDVTPGKPPRLLPVTAVEIRYGASGSLEVTCPLPLGRELYETPGTGAIIEVARACGKPPDDYSGAEPVIRVYAERAEKWTWLPLPEEDVEWVSIKGSAPEEGRKGASRGEDRRRGDLRGSAGVDGPLCEVSEGHRDQVGGEVLH